MGIIIKYKMKSLLNVYKGMGQRYQNRMA